MMHCYEKRKVKCFFSQKLTKCLGEDLEIAMHDGDLKRRLQMSKTSKYWSCILLLAYPLQKLKQCFKLSKYFFLVHKKLFSGTNFLLWQQFTLELFLDKLHHLETHHLTLGALFFKRLVCHSSEIKGLGLMKCQPKPGHSLGAKNELYHEMKNERI